MISCANLFSSTHLRSWICPSLDLWRTRGLSSCMNHPQHRNTVSVRGSRGERGGQIPPYAVVSGWKRNSDDPSPVQQAQGIRFPVGLRWRSSGGRQAWQQCLWGQPVAVAIWAWQAAPGWPVSWGDCREEASSQGWKPQACSWDSSAAQGGSNLIPNEVWWWTVYILCVYWYILVCPILTTASLKLGIYCVVFILDRAIWSRYSMHWIGIIWCWTWNIITWNCAHVWNMIWSQVTVHTCIYHIWSYVFFIY